MGVIMDLKGRVSSVNKWSMFFSSSSLCVFVFWCVIWWYVVQKSSREDDRSGGGVSGEVEDKKACTDCKTTKTPLWRGGPAGPKVCMLCCFGSLQPCYLPCSVLFAHGFFFFWVSSFHKWVFSVWGCLTFVLHVKYNIMFFYLHFLLCFLLFWSR